jgi:hypothetical protein
LAYAEKLLYTNWYEVLLAILLTTVESILVHPFIGFVAVTKYLPEELVLTGFTPAVKPPHVKIALGVADEAVRLTEVVAQVIVPFELALTPGFTMFCKTLIIPVATQLLAGLVMVRL